MSRLDELERDEPPPKRHDRREGPSPPEWRTGGWSTSIDHGAQMELRSSHGLIERIEVNTGTLVKRMQSWPALLRVARAPKALNVWNMRATRISAWYDDEAALCAKRTGIWPNGKDIIDEGHTKEEREAAWETHMRERPRELKIALDASLAALEGGQGS